MRCRVAYRIGTPPGRWTRLATGTLSVDDSGICIEGPVPYRAAFVDIQSLSVTKRAALFYFVLESSPPVYITPVLLNLVGYIRFVEPALSNALYTSLHRHLGGVGRCARCGNDVSAAGIPCPA